MNLMDAFNSRDVLSCAKTYLLVLNTISKLMSD